MKTFTLTFDDEFDSLSLDTGQGGTWQPSYAWAPTGYTDASLGSWVVNPAWAPTAAVAANVYSNDGGLTSIGVKPAPADVDTASVGGKSFPSGQSTTYRSFSQLYGYFEADMKIPAGGSWPPELDVAEVLGSDPTTLVTTSHDSVAGQHVATPAWATIPDASEGFRRYGVEWEPDTITWYFDGVQVAQQATPADLDKPMYLLLDVSAGVAGSWSGNPVAGETGSLQVDYVRAYARNTARCPPRPSLRRRRRHQTP